MMKPRLKATLERLPEATRYALVLLVVVAISFLFPQHVRFKYSFEQGEQWKYEDLVAPFDFAIKKTPEEIAQARAEIEQNFPPYYELDPNVGPRQKREFFNRFHAELEKVRGEEQFADVVRNPDRYYQFGLDYLDRAYDRGIIQLAPEHQGKGRDFVINVIRGVTTKKETLGNLWTVERVRDHLTDTLPFSKLYVAEFLLFTLPDLIQPNLFYNDSLTRRHKQMLLDQIVTTKGVVQKGEVIVRNGEYITAETYQKLLSFKEKYQEEVSRQRTALGVFLGYLLLTTLILGAFTMYIRAYYAQEVFQRFSPLIFILFWFVLFSYLVYGVEKTNVLSTYAIPFCIVPIVIKHFHTDRLAFFSHVVVVLLASFLSSLGYEFTFMQILAGIVAVLTVADARNWSRFFSSVLYIGLTYLGAFIGLSLIQEGSLLAIDWSTAGWLVLNMVFILLAFPLIPLLERVFGYTSALSLVELSDMSRPLLKELSLRAPGTLQHSLQVANLSEAAAEAIGANPLLVKVGALYHDIGKMKNPEYFIENQSGTNPHEGISAQESARIIIEHVEEGLRLAKKYRLPQPIINFILTHHGTTRVEFFYRIHAQKNPDEPIDELKFRYPGPRPKTKEETILMLADSIEAASKSLKNPTGQSIDELVDRMVDYKIKERQLNESEMTFEELEKCKVVFKQLLRSIYHIRIEYPDEPAQPGSPSKTPHSQESKA